MKTKILILFLFIVSGAISAQGELNIAVVGLNHDHAYNIMNEYKNGKVNIVGIAETDKNLIKRYKNQYNLPENLFYKNTKSMLTAVKADAVMAYNPISEHIDVARICLPMKIPLMVEKPLAINNKEAEEMAQLSHDNNTWLLTNFETTWYASNQTLKQKVKADEFGMIKKMIAKDGHQGPKEIGCSTEFTDWLCDPKTNGAGALVDFGCYGANLMTWLQDGKKPIAVTAVTRHFKPEMYPKVDDDATIILEYEHANGIIEASWDWSYSIKGFEAYGSNSSYNAVDGNTLTMNKNSEKVDLISDYYKDHLTYLKAVLDGNIKPGNDLSSLSNNLIVVEILQAAKKSAETGKRVKL